MSSRFGSRGRVAKDSRYQLAPEVDVRLDLGQRHCRPTALRRIDGAHKARDFPQRCCYYRGFGKVFYFRLGHETFPHVLQ